MKGRPRYFDVTRQSKHYDAQGEFIRAWLPELKHVPLEYIHEPWLMTDSQREECNLRLGIDYPVPITKLKQPRLSAEDATKLRIEKMRKKRSRKARQ
jgi:deoxyribodipyrimidine photo-lyase